MPCSPLTLAKRAFVKVLLALASSYGVAVQVNRDTADHAVLTAYKRVALKVHPDKGGTNADFQKLQAAKENWERAKTNSAPPGRPQPATADLVVNTGPDSDHEAAAGGVHRVNATAVLLTYFGGWSQELWKQFLQFVRSKVRPWSVWRWCATLERSEAGNLHVHLQLQFRRAVDRVVTFFAWEGRRPNASTNDYLGGGTKKADWQASVDRAFFYVFADKIGTQKDSEGNLCVDGTYLPVWTKARARYQVLGKWPEKLWKQHKLTHDKYEEYLPGGNTQIHVVV